MYSSNNDRYMTSSEEEDDDNLTQKGKYVTFVYSIIMKMCLLNDKI